jgi:universal stress protein E
MAAFSKILCVIDPTRDLQPAMQRAAGLARQSGATMELLSCYYNQYLGGERFFDSKSLQQARAEILTLQKNKLESLAEPLRATGLTISTTAVWDHPLHEGIVRQSIALNADVVFKDTHYHSALSRAIFTNTDWSLIRTCPVPLWLVGPREKFQHANIIAAIDPFNEHDKPASLDERILAIGKSIATDIDGDLHAFHSFNPWLATPIATADAYVPTTLPLSEIEEETRKSHEKRLLKITKSHGIAEDHTHLRIGLTHRELPELEARLDANLVIMGAVSRNRLKRLFIGATAERTLGELTCDLLIVKPKTFRTPIEIDESAAA